VKRPWTPRRNPNPGRPDPRALLAALVAGLGIGLAFPPFGVLPGLLGWALLLWLVERAPADRPVRSAALRGWLAGLGFFGLSLWWVAEAFLVDAAAHAWMIPIVMLLLPGGVALFWAGACALYRALAPSGPARFLVFAAAVGVFEWLRGHVLTGFPWNLPGEVWRAGSAPSQAASVFGAYGLSVVTVALAAAPALAFGPGERRARALALGVAAAILAGLYGFGAWRLAQPPPAEQSTVIRIVQADVEQGEKWRPENLDAVLADYLRLTTAPGLERVDAVIWPEGAIPSAANDYLGADVERRRRVAAALRPDQTLLTGAFRVEPDGRGGVAAFNTFLALQRTPGPDLRLTAVYDKHRLVPLGEFLPLRPLLEPIGFVSLVNAPADFTAGPRPAPVSTPGLPRMQPLICYESLFPGFTSDEGGRPSWIVNGSNDAWFGHTSGPWQHLNIASYRAIEEGLPLIRATPTGVSAVIDAYGRPLKTLAPGAAGVIDSALPGALAPTVYSKFGEFLFWSLAVLGFVAGGALTRIMKIA
jgi:apolipoprotein N-acyltransferase